MAATEHLRTRVAARILGLFFVGTMVPVAVLAVLSHRAVTRQLTEQSEERLLEMADGTAQLILERLSTIARWAGDDAGRLIAGRPSATRFDALPTRFPPGVLGVATRVGGETRQLVGDVPFIPTPTEGESAWLRTGGPLLKLAFDEGRPSAFLALQDTSTLSDAIWVHLSTDSIWGAAMTMGADPTFDDLCVLSGELRQLACVRGDETDLTDIVPGSAARIGIKGVRLFDEEGLPRIAAWRSVYLRSSYGAPEWFVVVSQTTASVLQPGSGFTYNLIWALAVGFALVLFLTNRLVTRTMEPLAKLQAGTQRIARRDLSVRVDVEGDDEFSDLATAFNSMASELGRQFRQLEASQAIDRAVIESSDIAAAVGALIDGAGDLLEARKAAVVLFDVDADGGAALCYRSDRNEPVRLDYISIDEREFDWVPEDKPGWLLRPEAAARRLGVLGIGVGTDHVYAAPMRVQESLVGVAVFTSDPLIDFDEADMERANQLVDRGAVALNEVRMRRELAELSSEALRALANTVDAKSRWTAGHSERVTELGQAIGRALGLGAQDLDLLQRGGLLHDIGKIGVPLEVLDFPGRLDDEMRRAVEAHPTIGARILEPIRRFRSLIPIVLHHHERWDGKGYPHGLAGRAIPRLARVLAVADVFDAMISPRPYRGPLPRDVVLGHIRDGIGTAFDPEVVAAFEKVIATGWVHASEAEAVTSGG